MKKGKVFGKSQVILALMVLALGAAVWLNMRVSSKTKYLGEATYVSDNQTEAATKTSAKAKVKKTSDTDKTDYFSKAAAERKASLESAKKDIEEMLDTDNLDDSQKAEIKKCVTEYAGRVEQAANIENLLKAKGFERAVAVIDDNAVNIVVSSEGLSTAQTLQIQDIVTAETGVSLGNIKIIAVK